MGAVQRSSFQRHATDDLRDAACANTPCTHKKSDRRSVGRHQRRTAWIGFPTISHHQRAVATASDRLPGSFAPSHLHQDGRVEGLIFPFGVKLQGKHFQSPPVPLRVDWRRRSCSPTNMAGTSRGQGTAGVHKSPLWR